MSVTEEQARQRVQLALEGTTCASCAARIEKRLNKLEGVEASVNYAVEEAAVQFDPARVQRYAGRALGGVAVSPRGGGERAAPGGDVGDPRCRRGGRLRSRLRWRGC